MPPQEVKFDAPTEVKFDAPLEVKFDQPVAPADQEGLVHKIWSRLWEPIRAGEYEKAWSPEEAEAHSQQFERERATGKRHQGVPNIDKYAWLVRAVLKSYTDFFSPGQLAMRFTGPLQVGAGAGFVTMQAHDLYENWDRMSPADKSAALMDIVGGTVLTGHGISTSAKAPPRETKPLTQADHLAFKYGLTPEGEMHGLTMFRDPSTGGSVYMRTEALSDQMVRDRVEMHRKAMRESPPPENDVIAKRRSDATTHHEEFRADYADRLPMKVGDTRYWFSQPIPTMRESTVPEVERVAELIPEAAKNKATWFHDALGDFDNIIGGLSAKQIARVAEIVDRWAIPHQGLGQPSNRGGGAFTVEEVQKAIALRVQLLNIWNQMHVAAGRTPGEFRLGFIQNYLPHLEKFTLPERLTRALRESFHDTPEGVPSRFTPDEPTTERRGRGLTQFILRRHRHIAEERIEYDLRKIMPRYLRGVSRVLFDRPAIFAAEESLKGLPENSTWRQYADAFLDKYTSKMHRGYYDSRIRRLARTLMNIGTRSVLGLSPRLQELHLARLVTSVFPEMNARDFAYGLAKVARNPKAAYDRAARVGILPQTVPLKYMGFWQRFDTVANYLGMADFIDRSVAFEGQYHRYLREGHAPEQALTKAIQDAKDFSFLAAPESTPLAWGRGAGMGFADAVSGISMQYKHIPTSLLYQYAKAIRSMRSDPAKAAKFTVALTTALLVQIKTGAHLVHFASNILNIGSVVGSMAQRVTQQLQAAWSAYEKGNEHKFREHLLAAIENTLQIIPGGLQVERARRYGLKSVFIEPSTEEKKARDRAWKRRFH